SSTGPTPECTSSRSPARRGRLPDCRDRTLKMFGRWRGRRVLGIRSWESRIRRAEPPAGEGGPAASLLGFYTRVRRDRVCRRRASRTVTAVGTKSGRGATVALAGLTHAAVEPP